MATSQTPITILDLKLSFLQSQIQLLSAPLSIPSNYAPVNEENALREKNIDQALEKLNESIRKHSHLSFSSQTMRHVAEQIDKLYWLAGARDVGPVTEGLERGTDYTADKNIAVLPDNWPEEEEEEGDEDRRAAYVEAVERLKGLDAQRRELRERVRGYRALKEILTPLDGVGENVQPNLVTRDGELEKELERMRLLVARVRGRVETFPERKKGGDGEGKDVGADFDMDLEMNDVEKEVEGLF